MKNLCLSFIILGLLLGHTTHYNTQAQTFENRTLADFHSVTVKGGFLVELIKGDTNRLELYSSELAPNKIITEVNKKGVLVVKLNYKKDLYQNIKYIDNEEGQWSVSGQVKIRITHKEELKSIARSGGGWLKVSSPMRPEELVLKNSGSGDIFIAEFWGNALNASCSGSGKIIIEKGNTQSQSLNISGSGSIDNQGLLSEKGNCNISGSGRIMLQVSQALEARISGTGSVIYSGTPKQLTSTVSGSGSVRQQ